MIRGDLQFAQDILDSVKIMGTAIAAMRGFAITIEEAANLDERLDMIVHRFVDDGLDPDTASPDNVAALKSLACEIRERYAAHERDAERARHYAH